MEDLVECYAGDLVFGEAGVVEEFADGGELGDEGAEDGGFFFWFELEGAEGGGD